jgi:hypothetical protein
MIRKAVWIPALALFGALASNCLAEPVKPAVKEEKAVAKEAPFVHVVIFRLKKDTPDGEIDAMITDCKEMLSKIPSVKGIKVGRPSDKGTPEIAKKDYQIGLLVLFDDADGLKTYLDHEQHLKFVEKHGKHIVPEKLDIFDFQDQAKK